MPPIQGFLAGFEACRAWDLCQVGPILQNPAGNGQLITQLAIDLERAMAARLYSASKREEQLGGPSSAKCLSACSGRLTPERWNRSLRFPMMKSGERLRGFPAVKMSRGSSSDHNGRWKPLHRGYGPGRKQIT